LPRLRWRRGRFIRYRSRGATHAGAADESAGTANAASAAGTAFDTGAANSTAVVIRADDGDDLDVRPIFR
jgi:hypothetical protein